MSMDLPELLEPERIRLRCDIRSKKRALQTLAELLGDALRSAAADAPPEKSGAKSERSSRKQAAESETDTAVVSDMDILDALISRERLGSTGLGHGIALPHSRLAFIDTPIAALITLDKGVDFESNDGEPVDVVLGLLVPQDCNDEHLKILANLARRFNNTELREALRQHDSVSTLHEYLQQLEPIS